jgi:hypothetical protein
MMDFQVLLVYFGVLFLIIKKKYRQWLIIWSIFIHCKQGIYENEFRVEKWQNY